MYHIAKKFHPLYLEKMDKEFADKGGRHKYVLNNLIKHVELCQQKYGGKVELATEKDDLIIKLCEAWEDAFCYGLKSVLPQISAVIKNVQEILSRSSSEPNFWEFCQGRMTYHERERFENLRCVWTQRGKTKAFIRAALNERSLERYVSIWLSDPYLSNFFEPWSLMMNVDSRGLLQSMAASLHSILFAISVDTQDINVTKTGVKKEEPIVYTPAPVGPSKKKIAIRRSIVSIENNNETNDTINSKPLDIIKPVDEVSCDKNDTTIATDETITGSEDSAVDVLEHFDISISESTKDEEDTVNNHEHLHSKRSSFAADSTLSFETTTDVSSSYYSSRQNSLQSSMSGELDANDLKEKLTIITEKCLLLEAKVAELSFENRRLHRLMNHTNSNQNWQFLISIPRAVLLKSGTKSYYVYEIHVKFSNANLDELVVLRRYSEFLKLHQKFKKTNPSIKALDFPPKKRIGNTNIAFVEERRQRLQIYLRHLLEILPEVSNSTTMEGLIRAFPFLGEF